MGDIQTGPFCTFGLRTRDERLTKSAHGENDYRSTDVTERNLLELFHEIQAREAYEHNTDISRRYGAVRLQMGNRFTWNECDIDVMQEYDQPWLQIEGVKINFLSADEVFTLQDTNGRWHNFFDVAFVGHNYFAFIKPTFTEALRENALLIMETKLLTLARKEAVAEFEEKLKNFAKTANLTNCLNYNAINAHFTAMKFRKQMSE